jgi:apolipoprotein N-acyltransferase
LAALLGSACISLEALGLFHPAITTLFGITALYLLLGTGRRTWFVYGVVTGVSWFWWVGLSFNHYHMPWAIPIVVIAMGLLYAVLFWAATFLAEKTVSIFHPPSSILHLTLKAAALLGFSYIHPFGFDWFKPELMFVNSYLGIQKWQFAIILAAVILSLWRRHLLFLLFAALAYSPLPTAEKLPPYPMNIQIVTTHIPVEEKWDKQKHPMQFKHFFRSIESAIAAHKQLVVLPESVFPVFLNLETGLFQKLREKAKEINIVTGALYWDGKTPRNSTYIFTMDGKVTVAHKVLLVPFGESNPLPDFLSDWINKIFYEGAVDYKADSNMTDYTIDGNRYRNAICFEATSETLYQGSPEKMIVLSNNGWFTPSIEPTLQKLLLQYYSRKYGTAIYHSVNMSESYIIQNGQARSIK